VNRQKPAALPPGARLAALCAKMESGEIDRTLHFAKWLIDRADKDEIPQLISWIKASKPHDLAEILRQLEMTIPPNVRRMAKDWAGD
jgi:hypothetical protein